MDRDGRKFPGVLPVIRTDHGMSMFDCIKLLYDLITVGDTYVATRVASNKAGVTTYVLGLDLPHPSLSLSKER